MNLQNDLSAQSITGAILTPLCHGSQKKRGFLIEQRVHGDVVNRVTEPTMNAKQPALDAYLARTAAIHAKPERLQQLADDHFGRDPDAIHWGHAGDLGRMFMEIFG